MHQPVLGGSRLNRDTLLSGNWAVVDVERRGSELRVLLRPNGPPMSSREHEVLRSVLSGVADRELSIRMGITRQCVCGHLGNGVAKLGTESRFAALQAQLNPHFLFNTLNTIAVLVRDNDREGAVRIVEHLSEVLRRTLSRHRANEVTLSEELELVRQYVAIEQARFSDRLRPEFRIPDALLSAAVPSFALQHLVENAIRHGIARDTDAGLLSVTATRAGDFLEIAVVDDGPGIDPTAPIPTAHGIENTRERLRALYGERASLEIVRRPEGGTIATLRVPHRELEPEANDETS